MTLAFDHSKSPHYRIIHVYGFYHDEAPEKGYQIEIYSSQTRTCPPLYAFSIRDEDINMCFHGGVYWNNAVHYLNQEKGFVLYFNLD